LQNKGRSPRVFPMCITRERISQQVYRACGQTNTAERFYASASTTGGRTTFLTH